MPAALTRRPSAPQFTAAAPLTTTELQQRYAALWDAQVKLRRLGADTLAEGVGCLMDDTLRELREHGINCDQWGCNAI